MSGRARRSTSARAISVTRPYPSAWSGRVFSARSRCSIAAAAPRNDAIPLRSSTAASRSRASPTRSRGRGILSSREAARDSSTSPGISPRKLRAVSRRPREASCQAGRASGWDLPGARAPSSIPARSPICWPAASRKAVEGAVSTRARRSWASAASTVSFASGARPGSSRSPSTVDASSRAMTARARRTSKSSDDSPTYRDRVDVLGLGGLARAGIGAFDGVSGSVPAAGRNGDIEADCYIRSIYDAEHPRRFRNDADHRAGHVSTGHGTRRGLHARVVTRSQKIRRRSAVPRVSAAE